MPIRGSRHPHELAFVVAALLLGAAGVLFFARIATTNVRMLPTLWGYILFGGMAVLSAVTLVGVFVHSVVGALLERAGLISLALFLLAYGVGFLAVAGWRGVGPAVFVTAFAVANVVRARQISRAVRGAYQLAEVIAPEEPGEEP